MSNTNSNTLIQLVLLISALNLMYFYKYFYIIVIIIITMCGKCSLVMSLWLLTDTLKLILECYLVDSV